MVDIRKELNSFEQSVVNGMIAMISGVGPETLTVMVDADSAVVATELMAGFPVKLVDGVAAIPEIDIAVPETDDIHGIVIFNAKQSSYLANDVLQISTQGMVMHLMGGATIAKGARVGIHITTYKLIAATATNFIGFALDPVALDALARVELAIPTQVAL